MIQSLQVRQEKEASFTGFLLDFLRLEWSALAVRLHSPAVWNRLGCGARLDGAAGLYRGFGLGPFIRP